MVTVMVVVVVVNDNIVDTSAVVASLVSLSSPVDSPDSSPSVVPTSPPDFVDLFGLSPLFFRNACHAAFLSRSDINPDSTNGISPPPSSSNSRYEGTSS